LIAGKTTEIAILSGTTSLFFPTPNFIRSIVNELLNVILFPDFESVAGIVTNFVIPFMVRFPLMLYVSPDLDTADETNLISGYVLALNHSAVCAFLSLKAFPVEIELTGMLSTNLHVEISVSSKSIDPEILAKLPEGSALLKAIL